MRVVQKADRQVVAFETPEAIAAPPAAADISRTALRDLLSLLALTGLWAGKNSSTILALMADAVSSVVPLAAVIAQVQLCPDKLCFDYLKVGSGEFCKKPPPSWLQFVADSSQNSIGSGITVRLDSPLGPLRLVRMRLLVGSKGGHICFASKDTGFPAPAQAIFLRAAVTLLATALHTASMDYERVQANRAKDEFLAMLGHELRNPLAPIVTAMDLIHLKGPGHLSKELAVIGRQVGHLSTLVDDLLDITRITRDAVVLKMETVNMRVLLKEAVESVSALVEEKGHRVSLEIGEMELPVSGDAARITQIVANLLINAAKYTEPGGCITVKAGHDLKMVFISITDDGIGISRELLPKIFDLFEQATTSTDRARGGLGIGLAIVKKLVSLHGGTVTAKSRGLGLGSTFAVELPLAIDAVQPHTLPLLVQASRSPRRLRILVVDDNLDALQTLEELLGLSGYEVLALTHPSQALDKAPGFNADVYILDIGLPGMDGYQLAGKLRQQGGGNMAQAKFIALTGYAQQADKSRALEAGFAHHYAKPVDIENLLLAIEAEFAAKVEVAAH